MGVNTKPQLIFGSEKKKPRRLFFRIPKKLKIILLAIVVASAGGVGVYYYQSRPTVEDEIKLYNVMIKKTDDYLREGNQNAAKRTLEDFLETNPKVNEHLYNVEIRLAVIYRNLGNYKQTKELGEKALTRNKEVTYDTYIILAESSQKLGDKKSAIEYYEKCIELLKKRQDDVSVHARIMSLELSVGSLKASTNQ